MKHALFTLQHTVLYNKNSISFKFCMGSEAIFTWYLKDDIKSRSELRKEFEKKNRENNVNNSYPSYEALKEEKNETKPSLVFTIKDNSGNIVRKLFAGTNKGLKRMKWDLRYESKEPVDISKPSFYNPFAEMYGVGTLVAPGTYSVTLSKIVNGVESKLDEAVTFEVIPLKNAVLPAEDREALAAFQDQVNVLSGRISGVNNAIRQLKAEMNLIRAAINSTPYSQGELLDDFTSVEQAIKEVELAMNGDPLAGALDIGRPPSINARIGMLTYEQGRSTSKPTKTHQDAYNITSEEFEPIYAKTKTLLETKLETLKKKLKEKGAPYTPGNLSHLN